jgi:heat shock protein HslJ
MQQVLTQSHTSLVLYDNNTISGVGGCNNYSGPYQLNGTQLTFGSLTVTSMTCDNPPGIMDQESQYFAMLATTTRYEITSNQLNLYNQAGQLVLQYVAAVQPR